MTKSNINMTDRQICYTCFYLSIIEQMKLTASSFLFFSFPPYHFQQSNVTKIIAYHCQEFQFQLVLIKHRKEEKTKSIELMSFHRVIHFGSH